jgi:hypothetical protein
MSLNINRIPAVCVRDPRTVLTNKREYAVLKSGSQTTWKQYTTTSISNSSISFSCPPPSSEIIVDRKQYVYFTARASYTGIPPNGMTLLNPGRDAPRAFPFLSSTDTLSVTINNQSVSINIADILHALLRYNTDAKLTNLDYSMAPSMLDTCQEYADLFGSIKSPLGNYADSNLESVAPRGAFPGYYIVANPVSNGTTPVTAIVDIASCEPVLLSPFYWGKANASGLYGVTTIDFNWNFVGNMGNRLWSHDDIGGTNLITSSSVVMGGMSGGPTSFGSDTNGVQPIMYFNYITPYDSQQLSTSIPLVYPYFDVVRYPTDFGSAVEPGSLPITISSNNIQLNSIPRRLYVFVRETNNNLYSNPSHTDTFFQINNISIQHMNKNGLLASASMNQLYTMSLKNHCNMSYTEWSGGQVYAPSSFVNSYGTIGSVVCIEFATDIGLDPLDAPGKNVQNMLQVTVTCTNVSNHTISPTLYMVTVLEGTFTILDRRSFTNIGVITSQDILDCQQSPFVNYKDVEMVNGGDFFSGLKSFFSGVNNLLKDSKVISTVSGLIPHPISQGISAVSRNLGYGDGGVMVGGRQLTRAQLKNRLRS